MSLAGQFIFHPSVSQSLKLGATTLGRDKLYRAVQYFARFYAWYLLNKGEKDTAARWSALKIHLATARKLLRLGKPIEHLQAALRVSLKAGPPTEQITTIARQVAYFGYLFFDGFVWANSVKFITFTPETSTKLAKAANRFWLAGILFSLVHGTTKLARLSRESKRLSIITGDKNLGQEVDRDTHLHTLEIARTAMRRQLLIDSLDVWIPASGLGYSNMNDGVLGIFGLITSVLALQTQWAGLSK